MEAGQTRASGPWYLGQTEVQFTRPNYGYVHSIEDTVTKLRPFVHSLSLLKKKAEEGSCLQDHSPLGRFGMTPFLVRRVSPNR